MSRIPPVTPPPTVPVPHHARKKPPAPPSVSLGGEPPFQGAPPKVGLGVNVKV